jgi:leucyl aminopeptidase
LGEVAKDLDKKTGHITKALRAADFKGKKGEFVSLYGDESANGGVLIIAGAGKKKDLAELQAQKIGGAIVSYLVRLKLDSATIAVRDIKAKDEALLAALAYGARLSSYRFDKYRTTQEENEKFKLKTLSIVHDGGATVQSVYDDYNKTADGVFASRDLKSEPANIIYPETLAAFAKGLEPLGLKVEVLDVAAMKKLGMNALLGVGQGSENPSRLIILKWMGDKSSKKTPLALVGKGVTFDSGGISIKPSGGMEEMKWDMGGAAAVIGTLMQLASRKVKANVVGIVGAVENMPSGNAQRPGDVVKSMSGQTIEVINTDAEGRLVLCDALWYAQEKFEPETIIDLATLTGAVIVAIGIHKAGLFANDEKLAAALTKAGDAVGEHLWRLPLGDEYDKHINSDIADMKNTGKSREAGSTAGAVFLQRFIKKGVKWAHLDIAGTVWSKDDSDICPKGATGYGVRLLARYIDDNFAK